jgi:hypothetical protein
MRCLALLFLALAFVAAHATEPVHPFSRTLTPEQARRLGLGDLTAAQRDALDAAIAAYSRGEATVAVQQAVQQAERQSEEKVEQAQKQAADAAVAEYKKKQEPGVIARTLEVFKRNHDEQNVEHFVARVVGKFRGWSGGTYFPLENGQVWRQSGTEDVEMPPVQNAEVEIYRSGSGYWRLRYNGAWITVKRLQ